LRNIFTKIVLFILLPILIAACNATKHVPENEYLLEKNTIIVNEQKKSSPEVYSYLRQKPNQKILGIPFFLHLYNFGNPDTLSLKWPSNRPKFKKRFSKKFSDKQFKALERSSKGFNRWFLKSGNVPVISDIEKIKKSAQNLENYYFNNGYWDATVDFKENKNENKRITVDYIVSTKNPYFLDTVSTKISSPILDSIHKTASAKSLIKKGQLYKAENFAKEEDRLVQLYRNSGIYHFNKGIISFDVDTTNMARHKQNVQLKIPNRIVESGDSIYTKPYKIQIVKNVNVFTDFAFNTKDEKQQDSAIYNGIKFYAFDKLKYNPKYLANSIIIQPRDIYKDTERDLTRKYLRELQNFRPSVDIKYEENEDESLTANVFLTPLKKYSLEWDADFTTSNINRLGVLGKLSFLNRNVFKGAEILELSFQGSFLNTVANDNNIFFNAYEIGTGASLKIPRILFPLKTTTLIPKSMSPRTEIGVNLAIQNNIGLDRQNITGSMGYTWQSSLKTNHKFELLNVQYIRNTNPGNYFQIYESELIKLNEIAYDSEFNTIEPINNIGSPSYDTFETDALGNPVLNNDGNNKLIPLNYIRYILENESFEISNPEEFQIASNVEEQREILIEDVLVPVISYAYNYSNREGIKDNSFSSFTGRIISSGSLTSAFIKKPNDGTRKGLFGLPVAQYLKTEFEYKKYWSINLNTSLVFRQFVGMAIPFGNSDDIPFSRSYRAGGSNDIRAWQTFDLGPGSELSSLEFNVGSLKLTTNIEYRFKVINSLNGALFIDAGNVWDITNSPLSSAKAKFDRFNSFKDIAIGSGFGGRYDFGFLIFRLDLGFKTYEPYNLSGNKWFQNYNFKKSRLQIGINYPF
jgi:outer membrane protein assembly factor BamA